MGNTTHIWLTFFNYLILLFALSSCTTQKKYIEAKEEIKWYSLLPSCPCESPDKNGVVLNDGWAREKNRSEMGFLQNFLRGKRISLFTILALFHPFVLTHQRLPASMEKNSYPDSNALMTKTGNL